MVTRFKGRGDATPGGWEQLPVINPGALLHPRDYVASDDLAAAVNVALTLGMPLLLTGEPGSGKSQLAYRLAWELGFEDPAAASDDAEDWRRYRPLKFAVKSTTEASDLFYTFDTVGRFHAAQINAADRDREAAEAGDDSAAVNFIDYQALGLAILRAKGRAGLQREGLGVTAPQHDRQIDEAPRRSVVLIDEIDKAPRDVPNDILTEIEDMRFSIPELRRVEIELRQHEQQYRPVVIITSNAERDLPEAFLRRCVYYHVPFPPFEAAAGETSVRAIVEARLGARFDNDAALSEALALFQHLRVNANDFTKPPSVAELLQWLSLLHFDHFGPAPAVRQAARLIDLSDDELQRSVLRTLAKTEDDHQAARALLQTWKRP